MVLLNVSDLEDVVVQKTTVDSFDDWRAIYDAVFEISEKLHISPHLQDDYGGGNEFHVWCTRGDFPILASAITDARLKTNLAFKVVVIELNNDNPTGKQHSIDTAHRQ